MKQTESGPELNTAVALPTAKLAKSWIARWIYIALAWLCLALGTLGIVIPGLPTFDFYFLATVFAAKGSAKLHARIVNNRIVAPILKQWQTNRSLPLRVKIASLISMSVAAAIMIFTVPHPWAVAVVVVIMLCVQLWMWLKT